METSGDLKLIGWRL